MEKKASKQNLLLKIIQQKILEAKNKFRGNSLHLKSKSLTPTELSDLIGKNIAEIVSFFWNEGKIVNKNQPLTLEELEKYCRSLGIEVKQKKQVDFREIIEEYLTESEDSEITTTRPPLVSIMGHIDHGKTTLLDTIRGTNVQRREFGGITQKVSVSQIEYQGKKITFLDTPGHSDFIKMRHRGISLTDVVVLVIDAKEGIMSQTEEIINYLQDYNLPLIVFLNHKKPEETDNESNINRLWTQLQERNIVPIEWGGETMVISGSAKVRDNLEELLESIFLISEKKITERKETNGVVIDSYINQKNGWQVTEFIILGGELKEKDNLFLNGKFSKVKVINDINGKRISSGSAGEIVQVIGLSTASAELGDKFLIINQEEISNEIEKELVDYLQKNKTPIVSSETDKKSINLIISADTQNRLETLEELIKRKNKQNSKINFNIIYSSSGRLNQLANNLARLTESKIILFGLRLDKKTQSEFQGIEIFNSNIIYELDDKLEELINEKKEKREVEKILGEAEITEVFYFSKVGKIAGCRVISGTISRNNNFRVYRKKDLLFTGKIESLQSNKVSIKEARNGQDCGLVFRKFEDFEKGDKVVAFTIEEEIINE